MAYDRNKWGLVRDFTSASSGTNEAYSKLLEQYSNLAGQAETLNTDREKAITAIFDEVINRYRPGGSFGKGYLAELEKQKVRDVSSAQQYDISRGLYGLRNRGQEWESSVGSGARLKLEDLMMERLSSAQLGKASFLENIQTPYPDLNPLLGASAAQASAPTSTRTIAPTDSLFSRNMLGTGGGGLTTQSAASSTPLKGGSATPGAYSGQNVSAEAGKTYGNLLGNFDPAQANTAAGNTIGGGTTGGSTANADSYPTMQEALQQGVGAIGRDYKGTLYKLTANGWIRV